MQLPITVSIDQRQPLVRLMCRGGIVGLTLRADGRALVERSDGSLEESDIESGTTVYPSLVVLRLRMKNGVESLVLPRGATGRDAHRRLRIWLKWQANASA